MNMGDCKHAGDIGGGGRTTPFSTVVWLGEDTRSASKH